MPIQPTELRWYKPATITDTTANGGRMSNVEAVSGVKNNILPDITLQERTDGLLRYRKMFLKVANDDDLALFNGRVFVQLNTPGDDNVTLFAGTQRDTQAAITGSERKYGAGRLASDVIAGATSFDVNTEGAALNYIQNGDLLRITDKTTLGGAGSEEFVTATGVSYAGDVATVTIAAPGLDNGYSATGGVTGISSVLEVGEVSPTVTAANVTSAAGVLDDTTYPIVGDNIATVEQDWTLTFTSGTAFNVVGDTLGSVGTGNTTAGAAPGNASFSGKPYFTLPPEAFSGTWLSGDIITFTTSPAAVPVWYRHSVPAAAASLSGNRVIVGFSGESA